MTEVGEVVAKIGADDKEFIRAMSRFDLEMRRAEKRGEEGARKAEKSTGKMMGGFGLGKLAGIAGIGAIASQSALVSSSVGAVGDILGASLDLTLSGLFLKPGAGGGPSIIDTLSKLPEALAGADTPEEIGEVLGREVPNVLAQIIADGITIVIPALAEAIVGALKGFAGPDSLADQAREAFEARQSKRPGVRGDLERATQQQGEPIIIGLNRLLNALFDTPALVPGGGPGRFP